MEGPTPVEHKGVKVVMFTLLPAGQGIEEKDAPILATEEDLESDLKVKRLMGVIDLHFENKVYEYRTHILRKGFILVETDLGWQI
jgi:hypothetical protein